jgi:hypothetical protein
MKNLTTLEQILKIFRIPRTEDGIEIEKLDLVIAHWDGQSVDRLISAIFDVFKYQIFSNLNESDRKRIYARFMTWINQDIFDYLRMKVGQTYINEFGDELTREKGYAVNIKASLQEQPGYFRIARFEKLGDAKAWINVLRKRETNWNLNK